MKTNDISDIQVIEACKKYHENGQGPFALEILINETEAPEKVALRAMERSNNRGLIDYGVSLRSAWPTEKGIKLINGISVT